MAVDDDSAGVVVSAARERAVGAPNLVALFQQAEWTKGRDERSVAAMLSGPSVCVAAWRSKRVVGFARAVGDGVYRAFVEDVIVDAAERGNGLGRSLMERLLAELEGVQEIKLSCVPELVPFYGKLGFVPAGLVGLEQSAAPNR